MFEARLQRALEGRGYACCRVGQGTWPRAVQEALRAGRDPSRWFPDLLAVGSDGRAVLVDAKAPVGDDLSHRDFCVELAAVEAHKRLYAFCPVAYVWLLPDGEMRVADALAVERHGRIVREGGRRGSGTPMMVVPRDMTHDMDAAFGAPR